MNVVLKTGFTVALFAICLLGLSAMTAEPSLAWQNCPAIECASGEYATMDYDGPCELYVAGSHWGTCSAYSKALGGPFRYSCYCGCNY